MVELIFLHLPKTGGSSFLEVLKLAYGAEHVRHFERDECLELQRRGVKISEVIGPEIKVIHGHIRFVEIKDIYKRQKPKLLTFLREPIARVVSNYYWWRHSLEGKPNHPAYHRRNDSLGTYLDSKVTRNKMSYFLKGASLKDFTFIGLLESFEEDLVKIRELFAWPMVPNFHEKNGESFLKKPKETIDDSLLNKLKRLNSKDLRLYAKVVKFRSKAY